MLGEIGVLYRGLVLGVIIAAPVGPVGLLCIRRSLQNGVLTGLATGLGAACADSIFAAISVMGVSAILAFIHHYEAWIRVVGGLVVLFSAWHTWRDQPKPRQPLDFIKRILNRTHENLLTGTMRAAFSGLIITITNPLTLFGTLAVVATFGGLTKGIEADMLVLGIFLGSVLWWLTLSGGVGLLRHHFTESRVVLVNRITAFFLALLALWAMISGARHLLMH